jgi:aminopeptidase N
MLASTEDEALAKRALELSLTDEVGATNTAGMISYVSKRFPELAFEFALAHRAQVDERVDATSRSRYYPELASASGQAAMIDKVREEQLPAIDAWLAKQGKPAARTAKN